MFIIYIYREIFESLPKSQNLSTIFKRKTERTKWWGAWEPEDGRTLGPPQNMPTTYRPNTIPNLFTKTML